MPTQCVTYAGLLTILLLAASHPAPAAPPPNATAALPPNAVDLTRAHREHLLADPHRPGYHFAIPEGSARPFDPNGCIFWKGRYHMFYIYQDARGHNFGHVSSTDLCHWRFHPTGLAGGMFSGNCFLNKEGKPTMCYHDTQKKGNSMAVAQDDQLNNWEKLASSPITPQTAPGDPHHGKFRSWDPYGWLEGDNYYAIFGGKHPGIVKSKSLDGPWKYVGDLLANAAPGVGIDEDVSCADFFKIGNKHMLLCISHGLGARYYLGEWKNEQFHPDFHEKMSWVDNSYFAPESLLDDKGRRIMWAWLCDLPGIKTRSPFGWSGTMSLPRVLTLDDAGRLRMNPTEELDRLRYNEQSVAPREIAADKQEVLKDVSGNSKELFVEMIPHKATKQCGVVVCRSPDGAEQTLVYYDAADKKLKIDTSKSSLGDGTKTVEAGPFELPAGQSLKLRVYIDKSVIEVFANDGRQGVMRRIYPTRQDSLGVALFSNGGSTQVKKMTAWEMMPSNPY